MKLSNTIITLGLVLIGTGAKASNSDIYNFYFGCNNSGPRKPTTNQVISQPIIDNNFKNQSDQLYVDLGKAIFKALYVGYSNKDVFGNGKEEPKPSERTVEGEGTRAEEEDLLPVVEVPPEEWARVLETREAARLAGRVISDPSRARSRFADEESKFIGRRTQPPSFLTPVSVRPVTQPQPSATMQPWSSYARGGTAPVSQPSTGAIQPRVPVSDYVVPTDSRARSRMNDGF